VSENIRIGKIVGFFQTFVAEPEKVEAGFVVVYIFVRLENPTSLFFPRRSRRYFFAPPPGLPASI
jgi:hypothetical protein